MLVKSNFTFNRCVLYPCARLSNFSSSLKFSSVNSFNLYKSTIVSFGKELNSLLCDKGLKSLTTKVRNDQPFFVFCKILN